MSKSRRDFLTITSLGFLGAAATARLLAQAASNLPPGAPPAFGTGPAFGPEVSEATFGEAEKLAQSSLTAPERATAAASGRRPLASVSERPTGPRNLPRVSTPRPPTPSIPIIPRRTPSQP